MLLGNEGEDDSKVSYGGTLALGCRRWSAFSVIEWKKKVKGKQIDKDTFADDTSA